MAIVTRRDYAPPEHDRGAFDKYGQQVPAQCNNPDAPQPPQPPQPEDHRDCPDVLYCLTGRTQAGYRRATATTYESGLLNRARG